MATTTENLGLTLPATSDPVDVEILDANFQEIDDFAGEMSAAVAGKATVDDIYGGGTAIESGTDLNSITTTGRYYCAGSTTASSLINTPYTAGSFILTVEKRGTVVAQTIWATSANTSVMYRRVNTGSWGAWYEWRDVGTAVSNAVTALCGIGTAIEANTDLNTITAVGTYNGASGGNYGNCPVTSAFRLEVVAIAYTVRRQQRLYPQSMSMSAYYIRSEGASGFGSWYKFTGEVVS